jgi:hypothetical protein
MEYGVSAFKTIPNSVQYAEVRVIVSVEEFQVQPDGFAAVQDLAYPVKNLKVCVRYALPACRRPISTIFQFTQKLICFRGCTPSVSNTPN